MFKCFAKLSPLFFLAVFFISCSSANNKPIQIRFSADSAAIVFSGIDRAGLWQIKNTPGIDTAYDQIISILKPPRDNDPEGKELTVKGKISITDSTLVFLPSEPFRRGESYLVMSYMNVHSAAPSMLLTGKLNSSVKPQQAVFKR